ncbi:MAG TPA: ASKHA domain-containing protein [Oceanipulchritudo sp.]|nr:ASKHA domain-containing protein [Oceanipulchritudo sp.]
MNTIQVELEGAQPVEVTVSPVYHGRPLSSVLARAGFILNTRCGQKGLCRGCEVRLTGGELARSCQMPAEKVLGQLIRIPAKSLLQGSMSVAVDFQPRCGFELRPLFERVGERNLGLCIDIGTTTVVMALVDLSDGRIIGRSSSYNAQVRMGEDVLTRIDACTRSADAVLEGQRLLLEETLGLLWGELMTSTGCTGGQIAGAVVAGNTTMLHLLVGEDPTPMGKVPFRPVFIGSQLRAHNTFPWIKPVWAGAEEIPWYLLPGYAAYVGADIAAGWLASGMADHPGITLLIDIGTNGEILLQDNGRLTGCATAAGPAFEGRQLSWGTRAIEGSISRLHGNLLDPAGFQVECVGRSKPRPSGFCGSAYLDFMALGAECGLLAPSGRLDVQLAADHGITLGHGEYGRCWYLNPADPEGPSISDADVALLLQAKAAIAAGVEILLKQAGVTHHAVERVYLAGGFGLNLGIESAIRCGLLAGFTRDQIEVVGNSSLGGAYVCLLDHQRAAQLDHATREARIIELNTDPDFEDTYIDHLNLEG